MMTSGSSEVHFWFKTQCKLFCVKEVISLSEGSTVDLRKPGEDEEDYSEMADDGMDPEECFPKCKQKMKQDSFVLLRPLLPLLTYCIVFLLWGADQTNLYLSSLYAVL